MWQGKPVSEWTEEEKNDFLALLIDEEDHSNEWWCEKCQMYVDGIRVTYAECHEVCGYPVIAKDTTDYFTDSGFFPIMRFMEKELPEVWDDYLEYTSKQIFDDWGQNGSMFDKRLLYIEIFNKQLDLSNLITYLIEHREEWGWKEMNEDKCEHCEPMARPFHCEDSFRCEGGKVKHSTLVWWDKEEK